MVFGSIPFKGPTAGPPQKLHHRLSFGGAHPISSEVSAATLKSSGSVEKRRDQRLKNTPNCNSDTIRSNARALAQYAAAYREPSHVRSIVELVITAGALVALWIAMWLSLGVGYWLTLILAVPAAGFLVRLFILQHDCGHGAFFRRRVANEWVGRALGIITFTPFDVWRRAHAMHHATTGNLDRRGIGDIETLTTDEYRARSPLGRVAYRVYRHPAVMFGLGPAYLFLLQHRIPLGMMRAGWRPWVSSMVTNAAIASAVLLTMWLVGPSAFLLVHVPIVLLAASAGVWLFYVQHQFDGAYWARDGEWDLHEAALRGSTHYDLPAVLHWFTANIGLHHIHHLCSRVPFYRLPQILRDRPELAGVSRLSLAQSVRSVRLALWDEGQKRLISFREARECLGI
ncbi:MAG: fatty acid desaturase [Alphaproteobacteria bacterium]|nr:fatty acid desaturase [Alphaproteobacteria bacterium]MBU6472438.1 fatty acid desaturase [Alphaproteobacteria bacterium]MDE2013817.1 fatty acid desaturase [Alphaproteobacteria bacterium]